MHLFLQLLTGTEFNLDALSQLSTGTDLNLDALLQLLTVIDLHVAAPIFAAIDCHGF